MSSATIHIGIAFSNCTCMNHNFLSH